MVPSESPIEEVVGCGLWIGWFAYVGRVHRVVIFHHLELGDPGKVGSPQSQQGPGVQDIRKQKIKENVNRVGG